MRRTIAALLLALSAGLGGCGEEGPPSRDQIPVLRRDLFALEEGIRNRNRAQIDSLLSVKILDAGQDSDSLLAFVYGPDNAFPFHRLGNYDIFYTEQMALINCYIMDAAENNDRPLKLTYSHEDTLWLLKQFEPGAPPDSTEAEW
jgi:hypothetical protein